MISGALVLMNISRANSGSCNLASVATPLACAAVWAQNLGLLASLPSNAAQELRACDAQGRDALMYAASVGKREVVQLVLRKGGCVSSSDALGNSALHYAVLAGANEAAADLVKAGALLNAQNHAGETPLFLAVREHNVPLATFLLGNCADPNVVTAPHEVSPLHMATVNGDVDLCRLLLKHGAFVNASDDVGETALHWAVCDYENGDSAIIRMLVEEFNANINAQNEDGETAIHHAAAAGMDDVVAYLSERGAQQQASRGLRISPQLQQAASQYPVSQYVQPPQQRQGNPFAAGFAF